MAADANPAAGLNDLGVLRDEARESEFVLARPEATAASAVIHDSLGVR
jgi:hypothetical protein